MNCIKLLMLASGMLLLAGWGSADQDYSKGLSFYIQGKYEEAQVLWLKSAETSNPKAMFNLGLLHDQGKISNADPSKAERWFDLAGQAGYSAADYYLANRLIRSGAPQPEVEKYLKRAVDNGSYPAGEMLRKLAGGGALAATTGDLEGEPQELAKLDANIGDPDDLSAPERYLTEDWITSIKPTEWTIQMLAFKDEAKVREFIDEHELNRSAAYFVEQTENGRVFKLVYGIYDSKRLADEARNRLSSALREHGPWLRTVSSVQEIIARQ